MKPQLILYRLLSLINLVTIWLLVTVVVEWSYLKGQTQKSKTDVEGIQRWLIIQTIEIQNFSVRRNFGVMNLRAKFNIDDMCRDQWNWASKNPYGYEPPEGPVED
ncbi:uncharacterized protein LOC141710828 [Apium graveolens]|uniref:uncharacterized protein LOC141710828 n=1 Tax=Apium graveolens TaxID=4045 RepID=UPI003D794F59